MIHKIEKYEIITALLWIYYGIARITYGYLKSRYEKYKLLFVERVNLFASRLSDFFIQPLKEPNFIDSYFHKKSYMRM